MEQRKGEAAIVTPHPAHEGPPSREDAQYSLWGPPNPEGAHNTCRSHPVGGNMPDS
jgi:hypothetical protein